MAKIYPYKTETAVIERLDKSTVAAAIIEKREEGLTKAQAIGPVLNGSDDIATFNEMWDVVEAERLSLHAVNLTAFATEAQYKSALAELITHLNPTLWVEGIKAERGITEWP